MAIELTLRVREHANEIRQRKHTMSLHAYVDMILICFE